MYIYACVYVFVHLCVYTHVYVYVYAYLSIDCGSQYQCFRVWTVSCMHMCVRVHMYAYEYVCRYVYVCIFLAVSFACTLEQVLWAQVHGQVCKLHRCVFTPTYTSANTLAAGCVHMCTFYTHVYVYVYAYLCIDCLSQYQCFSVWKVSCMCMCVRVHMYAYEYVCRCILFAVSFACTLEQVFWALVHGQVCKLHRCVFTPTYTSTNTLAAGCVHMCIFIYMCICMHIYMDAYVRL